MRLKIFFVFVFGISAISASAQLYRSAFHVGWNTVAPLSDKEFVSQSSSAGVRVGFTKFIDDRFGFGVEAGYNTLHDYVPRQTYEIPGGSITTDIYNYMYHLTIMANGQYYFMQSEKFVPYASLGAGIAFSEYKIFYNIYGDQDRTKSFVVRPEVGTLFRFREYSNWGLKGAVSYEFAANKSEYFDIKNFSGINILVGVVFFSD